LYENVQKAFSFSSAPDSHYRLALHTYYYDPPLCQILDVPLFMVSVSYHIIDLKWLNCLRVGTDIPKLKVKMQYNRYMKSITTF